MTGVGPLVWATFRRPIRRVEPPEMSYRFSLLIYIYIYTVFFSLFFIRGQVFNALLCYVMLCFSCLGMYSLCFVGRRPFWYRRVPYSNVTNKDAIFCIVSHSSAQIRYCLFSISFSLISENTSTQDDVQK